MCAAALRLADLNAMSEAEFAAALGGVFEHSPWIAERASARRPFADAGALHRAMVETVRAASRAEQLALLRAHPELAGREAQAGTLTTHSSAEQKGAGLVDLSPEEKRHIARLNAEYRARFGFPFIIAVRNYTRREIFAELERRVANDAAAELAECLEQVFEIARLRLGGVIAD
ncbi:MAG: 2-oxo-4-hydroxy-4-carboxy-5-ureidoimidazoline decarboxylase [Burkholderiales bacterium]|nr:2-oxo-4-hydroxy-4-carboxy-5-ureidoimidazoline decarboxylase [Burkholderiales bacterium]